MHIGETTTMHTLLPHYFLAVPLEGPARMLPVGLCLDLAGIFLSLSSTVKNAFMG